MSEEIDKLLQTKTPSAAAGLDSEPQTPVVGIFTAIFGHLALWIGLLGALVSIQGSREPGVFFFVSLMGSGMALLAIAAHLRQQAVTNRLLYRLLSGQSPTAQREDAALK